MGLDVVARQLEFEQPTAAVRRASMTRPTTVHLRRLGHAPAYHQDVTLADMILAHGVIDRIGMELALELLDVIDGDASLRPELFAHTERAAKLLEHELGDTEEATQQLKAVLQDALGGIQA